MSFSDQRHAAAPATDEAPAGSALDRLAKRLAASRGETGSAPRRDLEQLVDMLARRNIQTEDRLTDALEGLARWAGRAEGEQAPSVAPAPPRAAQPADAPRPATLRSALAEIAARQKDLDARDVRPAAQPEPAPVALAPSANDAVIADMRRQIEALAGAVDGLPTRSDVDSLLREIAAVAARCDAERPARLDPTSLKAIEALVIEVDRMRNDAASPQMLARFAEEVTGLSRQLEAIGPSNAEAIETLARHIDDIRGELAHFTKVGAVDGLASDIQALVARLDEQEAAAARRSEDSARMESVLRAEIEALSPAPALDAFAQRLDALTAQLGQRAAVSPKLQALPEKVEALSGKIDALAENSGLADVGRKVDAIAGKLAEPPAANPALVSLSGKMESLHGKMDTLAAAALTRAADVERIADVVRNELAALAEPNAIESVERRIESLAQQLAERPSAAPAVLALSERVFDLSTQIEDVAVAAQARGSSFERIEEAVRGIAEHLVATAAAPAAPDALFGIEQRIVDLINNLDRTDGRIDDLNAGFSALAARVEQSCAAAARDAGQAAADAVRESFVERDSDEPAGGHGVGMLDLAEALGELRAAAVRTDRRTADTLDAVRMTLDRLADRMDALAASGWPVERAAYDDRPLTAPAPTVDPIEAARAAARRAMAEAVESEPEPARVRAAAPVAAAAPAAPAITASRAPIEDDVFDLPMEPAAPTVRAPEPAPDAPAAAPSAASFIAAARRAAIQPSSDPDEEPSHTVVKAKGAKASSVRLPDVTGAMSTLKARRRPIVIALAAALIVLGVVKLANSLHDNPVDPAPTAHSPQSDLAVPTAPQAAAPAPAAAPEIETPRAEARRQEAPEPAPLAERPADPIPPSATSEPAPAPKPGAQLSPPRAPAKDMTDFAFSQTLGPAPQKFTTPSASVDGLTTGSINRSANPDALPDSIGGATLRMRAVQGDPSAQLEIADRFLDGRGVAADPAAAARWLEKAAAQGLAPAQHRLGSMYEKGRGVARDILSARRWYEQAAASGNVRAMHNLGVIYAEGGLGKPDFGAASVWFRMAAERGLADSQYNLAVLQARGLGGKRDLAEAYKWFALASRQGDQDAGRKRDEVAKALGANLTAAQQATDAFRPRGVDDSANEAPTPPGGWDQVSSSSARSVRTTPVSLR
ncbi:hypothetical protein [Methylopila turkensis]|uniref:Localization factor PodJL n=1 Tax=Methylopila turkensis TaxID=1437816 RepID=A0A9W6N5W5_9HYPH|nr:hypothetical protein [Methylopila turkensis]GLK78850.1 hypothetical protein GCM10008174_05910 [Methylopila turkensis]